MNDQRKTSFDPRIADWLEADPNQAPEQALDIVLAAFPSIKQRHGSRLPWRFSPMSTSFKLALGAAAVIAVVLGGAFALGSRPPDNSIGGPGPTPTPTASPSQTAVTLASEGFVYPGTHAPAFDPGLTFTIDREVQHNCVPSNECRGSINANLPGWMNLEFGLPRIEVNVVRVDKVIDPTKPGALIDPPADLAAWIASRPGVTVDAQKAIEVGGLPGTQLDVRTGDQDLSFGPIPGVADPTLGLGANWTARHARSCRSMGARSSSSCTQKMARCPNSSPSCQFDRLELTHESLPAQSGNASGPRSASSRASPEASSAGNQEYG